MYRYCQKPDPLSSRSTTDFCVGLPVIGKVAGMLHRGEMS